MLNRIQRRIAFARRFVFQFRESTATTLKREFLEKGVSADQIRGEHLIHTYQRLHRTAGAPDFETVSDMLPAQRNSVTDGTDSLWGVIVEVREHPALETVINNFVDKAGIPVQLFHGRKNLDAIRSTSIARLVDEGKVHLTQLDTDELGVRKYNALLMSEHFWKNTIGRSKILVFQTDAVFCGSPVCHVKDFLSYDYVGSRWFRSRPVGLVINGGNGGLSLRDWKKSYECLKRFPSGNWYGGEDGYFAFHIELMGGKVGRDNVCSRFSTQYKYLYRSCGGHHISNLSRKERIAFLKYCPDAKFILKGVQ